MIQSRWEIKSHTRTLIGSTRKLKKSIGGNLTYNPCCIDIDMTLMG